MAPQPVMTHQIGWVANVKLDPLVRLATTTDPAIATPMAAPTCLLVEAIAAATPACDRGIPATALLEIAGFTIPSPMPNEAYATSRTARGVAGVSCVISNVLSKKKVPAA